MPCSSNYNFFKLIMVTFLYVAIISKCIDGTHMEITEMLQIIEEEEAKKEELINACSHLKKEQEEEEENYESQYNKLAVDYSIKNDELLLLRSKIMEVNT